MKYKKMQDRLASRQAAWLRMSDTDKAATTKPGSQKKK